MKILMPVIQHKGKNVKLDDDIILSGVELFQKLVYQNIPNVVPVYISFDDRMKRNVSEILKDSIFQYKPDLIFTNHFSRTYTVGFQKYDIPVVWLNHSPGIRSLYNVESVKAMHDFVNSAGSLYHVSEHQFNQLNAISKRITGKDVPEMHGYINPAFSSGDEKVDEQICFDAVTVGRTDVTKNPFLLHKKLAKSSLTSAVITSTPLFDSPAQTAYAENNQHWVDPRYVFRDLSHVEVMSTMSKGAVYVSTCQVESWGITALEALSRGLPLILTTDSSGSHASQIIADSDDDYVLLRGGSSPADFELAVNKFKSWSHDQRVDLSTRTKEKHSKEKWCNSIVSMFTDSIQRYSKHQEKQESESLFKFS